MHTHTQSFLSSLFQFSYKPHEADWSRDMRGNELITPVPIENFVVISTRRDADKAHDFVVTLQKIGPAMGIRVNPKYRQLELDNDRTDNFIRSIDQNVEQNRTQLVCVPIGAGVCVCVHVSLFVWSGYRWW